MNKPIDLRFIPKWLSGVMEHYGANYQDFESIVSRHDVKLYRLANNILRTKLNLMRIRDFNMPAAELTDAITEDDAVFALYGQNPDKLTVPQFDLSTFKIVSDGHDGVFLVEIVSDEHRYLVTELTKTIAMYRGKQEAFESNSFRQYLTLVNKENSMQFGAEEFQARLKQRIEEGLEVIGDKDTL